ncbi:MAG: HlyD family efflux transporter periplasmic adaptor subunit [Caldilineaceae bacterium SB0661_bin_32]|uniref:HlyD family efflux transporter periplasmic adaptor subunit n=1 Tax=Caldilineaceae bacterium SB0661_bin_32 TaxID=2605255 RepID=A0A6B1DA83_9CHLR|nr:HlyD family efflux transporter periplasmic adaptor subunit [Caldilineaceae bacterium SB0661_bin_32]
MIRSWMGYAKRSSSLLAFCLLVLAGSLAGCEQLPGDVLVTPTPIPTPVPLPKAVHRIERGDIVDSVTLLGMVDSLQRVNLSFRIGGRLNGFHVEPGEAVEAGQLLAELDVGFLPHELAKAEKQLEIARLRVEAALGAKELALAEAQAALDMDRLTLEQARSGAGEADLARMELAVAAAETKLALLADQHDREIALYQAEAELKAIDVEMLRDRIGQAQLLAPFDGVVRYTDGEAGQLVAEYAPVMGLAAPDALEIRSSSPGEEELPKLRIGQIVTVLFRDYPQKKVTGQLIQVSTPGGADEGLPIRVEFAAPELELEIGALADLRIVVERKEDILTIPNAAIHSYFNRRYALVKEGESTIEVDISLGVTDGERTEVLTGLEEDEEVFER